jgi:predicted phosphodiesterase
MKLKLLFTVLCLAVSSYGAERVVGGPYVVNPAPRAATIGWVVETSDVKVGAEVGKMDRTVPVLRGDKVSLTGLKPGTTVYYQAFAGEEGKGRFKTPPAGRASFKFVVFGDTRSRHELHRKVIAAIEKLDPDFVVHTGDLVNDGYDTSLWPTFFDIERELLRKTVFFPVLGNHERDNARFYEFFDVKLPYYSFNWGAAHFAMIDSDVPNVASGSGARERFWTEQTRWLEDDLARNQKADFRFVVMHHPAYTVNITKGGHVSQETQTLVPLFEKYKVAAVFAGHDHNYQHHLKNGVHYIVTGGGGAPLAPAEAPLPGNITLKVESVEHYVPIEVEGNQAHIRAIALDGHVIETIELTAPESPAPAAKQ